MSSFVQALLRKPLPAGAEVITATVNGVVDPAHPCAYWDDGDARTDLAFTGGMNDPYPLTGEEAGALVAAGAKDRRREYASEVLAAFDFYNDGNTAHCDTRWKCASLPGVIAFTKGGALVLLRVKTLSPVLSEHGYVPEATFRDFKDPGSAELLRNLLACLQKCRQ